jgi:hypothetical protein
VTSVFTAPPAAVVLDSDGDYVWWHVVDNIDYFNVSRAHLSGDGKSMLMWAVNTHSAFLAAPQRMIQVSLDGQEVNEIEIADGHHDFLTHPDGTIAYIEYEVRDGLTCDRIAERKPGGDIVEVYSLWDDFESGDVPMGSGSEWCHSNAIDYDGQEDAYYISVLNFDGILKIDRYSGDLIWVFGGQFNDFSASSGSMEPWKGQHQFTVKDGAISLFNNGTAQEFSSKALDFSIDEDEMTAELVSTYVPSPTLFTPTLGDVHGLSNGNTLVVFCNQGQIDEITSDGTLVRRTNFSLGGTVGYATWKKTLY